MWARPNQDSNSVGNLLIHLTGNVTEWILGGVGGRSYKRYRAGELCKRVTGKPLSHKPLIAYLKQKYAPLYGI